MEAFVDKSKVSLRPIDKRLARDIIEKNHYSGRLSSCRYPLGIFYDEDSQHQFFDKNEKLVGVACNSWRGTPSLQTNKIYSC